MDERERSEIRAIQTLVERQFECFSWQDGGTPDRVAFLADFVSEARLFTSARPVKPQSAEQFLERMEGLAGRTLRSFDEMVLGSIVHVYGNVAVAVIASLSFENSDQTNRNVEMMLLVKDQSRWRIAAQAWDSEDPSNPIEAWLSSKTSGEERSS